MIQAPEFSGLFTIMYYFNYTWRYLISLKWSPLHAF